MARLDRKRLIGGSTKKITGSGSSEKDMLTGRRKTDLRPVGSF